jgi:hypothetical protein
MIPLDLIPKDVVKQTPVIPPPTHHSRPSQTIEKATAATASLRPHDPPGNDARKRAQEALKSFTPARPQDEMQMRTHVGKIVDPDFEAPRHATEHLAHRTVVAAHGPRASSSVARENQVHRASRAHGPLELALTTANFAAMLRSRKLDLRRTTEERELHDENNVSIHRTRGNVVSRKSNAIRARISHARMQASRSA